MLLRRALAIGLLVALSLAGCGGDDGPEPAAAGDPASPYWIAGVLPDGFVPVRAQVDGGRRLVAYAAEDDRNDVFDAPLRVIADDAGAAPAGIGAEAFERVRINDRDGYVLPLTDDGVTYGVVITWEQRAGLWLTVEGAEPLDRADVESVANGLEPVDADEWDRLMRSLSMDTHVGRVDPDAEELEITAGEVAGEPWVLTGLRPGGYPLGDDDRRLTCYRLTHRGESSKDLCDTHPWRLRVGGQVFVFGPAGDTRSVRIGPYAEPGVAASQFEPVDVATIAVDGGGQPERFYVLPVDDDVCFVEITTEGDDAYLGPIGPLPGDPEHATCLAQQGP